MNDSFRISDQGPPAESDSKFDKFTSELLFDKSIHGDSAPQVFGQSLKPN